MSKAVLDASTALARMGFSNELSKASVSGRVGFQTCAHLTLPIVVCVMTTIPKPFDFEFDIKESILVWTGWDSCIEYTEEQSEKARAFCAKYNCDTRLNSNEYEDLWWNDKTGFEGFIRFMEDKGWERIPS